jgi:hypothetical protein
MIYLTLIGGGSSILRKRLHPDGFGLLLPRPGKIRRTNRPGAMRFILAVPRQKYVSLKQTFTRR